MKLISFVQYGWCATVVSAATFKAPVSSARSNQNGLKSWLSELEARKWRCGYHQVQRLLRQANAGETETRNCLWDVLQQAGEDGNGISHIWDWEEWVQITSLTIGTPPQPFHAILSISDSDIFIPSSHCDDSCREHRQYNSNLSSTYIANGSRGMGDYLRFAANGIASQDIVHIAGIAIENLTFGEADVIWRRENDLGDDGYDGIVGMGPKERSNAGPFRAFLKNPFRAMIERGLLDRNVFGLKLSRGKDDPGEIMFGDINHGMYDGELKTLPLLNDTKDLQRIQGRWKVPASSISIGEGSASLEGYAATLESDFPLIALPANLVMLLENHLGMERKQPNAPMSINCSKRDELEDFTLTLGDHDFVITPYEYTIEIEKAPWGGDRCISAFIGIPEMIEEKYIIVGSSFLKAFYGVFDLDERTVSLGKVKGKEEWKPELKK